MKLTYEQQKAEDRPIVKAWHKALTAEIAEKEAELAEAERAIRTAQ